MGLTRRGLADMIGKTKSCISNYENGYRKIPVDTAISIIKVAATCGVKFTLDQLYGVNEHRGLLDE